MHDAIRELITSTTTVAVIDMPFAALFLFILYLIGGAPVAAVALCAIPLIAVPGLIAQWPMARHARNASRASALRNAMLVESIEGIEDIKALRAQGRFHALWNDCNTECAQNNLRSRKEALEDLMKRPTDGASGAVRAARDPTSSPLTRIAACRPSTS